VDPPGGGNDEVRPRGELLGLPEHVHAPDNHRDAEVHGGAEGAELLGELEGELARGRHHEGEHAEGMLGETVQDREREGGRLPAPCLVDAQHVPALQHARDAPPLHGARPPHPELPARLHRPFRQPEVAERLRVGGNGGGGFDGVVFSTLTVGGGGDGCG